MSRPKLSRSDIDRFLSELFDGEVHAKVVRSLSNRTLGVVTSASLAVHVIPASGPFVEQPGYCGVWEYFVYCVPYVIGGRQEVVVALDWTVFERDDHATPLPSAPLLLVLHSNSSSLLSARRLIDNDLKCGDNYPDTGGEGKSAMSYTPPRLTAGDDGDLLGERCDCPGRGSKHTPDPGLARE